MEQRKNVIRGVGNGFNPTSANTGSVTNDLVSLHGVYEGIVEYTDYEHRTLAVNTGKILVDGCEYLPGLVGSLIGVTCSSIPAAGSRVILMMCNGRGYVVGGQKVTGAARPGLTGVVAGNMQEDMTTKEEFQHERWSDSVPESPGMPAPRDMYPGELDISSAMGAAIRCLFNMAQLSAGEAAKVEVHLFNEMVRIVSGYFAHHSVGGDELIWSNGGCNKEEHFTSHQWEADGKQEESEAFAESDKKENTYKMKGDDPINATGRWRLSTYTGFLGDLIHVFVTSPTDLLTTYAEDAHRAGQFRCNVNSDGTLAVQAAGGVHIEVTPHIIIPTVHRKWDHPEKDAKEYMKDLDQSFLKIWGSGPDWKDLNYCCWQMRSYLQYIVQFHSISRWLQQNGKYCTVRPEADCEAAVPTVKEPDREEANPSGKNQYKGQASISIDPSGSIVVQSNNLTSLIMNNGNVQVAAAGNLELKAGGTISIQGRSVSVRAAGDIELVSLLGGIVSKARTVWKALCEKGRIWLKSDAFPGKNDDQPGAAVEGSPTEMQNYSIVLDSPNGKTLVHGEAGVTVGSVRGNVYVGSQSGNLLLSGMMVKIKARMRAVISSAFSIIKSEVIGLMAYANYIGKNCMVTGDGYIVAETGLFTRRVQATDMVAGPKSQNTKILSMKPDGPKPDVKISDSLNKTFDEDVSDTEVWSGYDTAELPEDVFKFYAWNVPAKLEAQAGLRESLWEDLLRVGSEQGQVPKAAISKTVMAVEDKDIMLQESTRTAKSYPWPGEGGSIFYYDAPKVAPMTKAWDKLYSSEDMASESDMKKDTYKYTFRKKEIDEEEFNAEQ